MRDEIEELRRRAVLLGETGKGNDSAELLKLYSSEYPAVRRAAASGLGKFIDRNPSAARILVPGLAVSIASEPAPQVLQYALKTLLKCVPHLNQVIVDDLTDIARDPSRKDYVRKAANEVIAAVEELRRQREASRQHTCSRCQKLISVEEARRAIDKYGKPYCHHCLEEKMLEDVRFTAAVEEAKKLRTVNEVAVQSQGERRIGDWLAQHGIAYQYDERIMIARDTRIRPDFYLPEFDLYIEYWGMDTPEYVENMRRKRILYQQARKKLISISYRDFDRIELVLAEKLSKYIKL